MEKKINSLYRSDSTTILLSIAILWTVVFFVLSQVALMSPDSTSRFAIYLSAFAVLAALTASSAALLMHLRKNKTAMYTEEINQHNHG